MRKSHFAFHSEHVKPHEIRPFRSILSALFLDNLGLSISYPIFTSLLLLSTKHLLPPHYSLSARLILLGLLIAAFPLAQLIGAPFIQSLSDTKGKKTTLIIALVGEGIGFLLSGIAIEIDSYQFLLFSRFFSGFFAGNIVLCFDIIIRMLPQTKDSSQDFGLVGSVAGMGFVIAIVLGGIFSNEMIVPIFRPSFPFWLMTILTVIVLWMIYSHIIKERIKTSSEPNDSSPLTRAKTYLFFYGRTLASVMANSMLRRIYLCFFFFMLGWTISLQFLVTMLIEHFDPTRMTITYTLGAVGLMWLITSLFLVKWLAQCLSARNLLLIGIPGLICALTFAASVSAYSLFLPLMTLGSFFAALIWTQSFNYMKKCAPRFLEESLLYINQSVAIYAMTFAPLFGALVGRIDSRLIYTIAIVFVFVSFILFIFRKKHF